MGGGMGYFLFFLVAFLTLTILLIWSVFPYIVLAVLLAYLIHPLERHLAKFVSSPGLRAGLSTLFVTVVVALPLIQIALRITREMTSPLYLPRIHQLLESARLWLLRHNAPAVAEGITQALEQGREFLVTSVPNLFGSVFNIALGIFVCLFLFYYFIKEGTTIWKAFLVALPLPGRLKVQLHEEITGILRAIFLGQLLTALVQGTLAGIGYLIFEIPQPLLLSVLTGLVAFLPVIGTPLVWGPAALLKLIGGDPTWQGLGLALYGLIVVMNVDNVLRPRLIALHTQVHPVVILIGIIGGTKVFGFIGFLVGPVIFAVFLQLLRFFAEQQLADTAEKAAPPTVRV